MSVDRIQLEYLQTYVTKYLGNTMLEEMNARPVRWRAAVLEAYARDAMYMLFSAYWVSHPMPYERSEDETLHVTLPRTWLDWRRVKKGKPPKRTRDARIVVSAKAVPTIAFPHCDIQFPEKLGPQMYLWQRDDLDWRFEG